MGDLEAVRPTVRAVGRELAELASLQGAAVPIRQAGVTTDGALPHR